MHSSPTYRNWVYPACNFLMNILLVGGTFVANMQESRTKLESLRSSVVDFIYAALHNSGHKVTLFNGGDYKELQTIIQFCDCYDVVFWWPNVTDNTLPKIRDVKEIAPHVILVTSKRNDGDRYSFMELTQHALAGKANLTFEFKKVNVEIRPGHIKPLFKIRVFDPLGCEWYNGIDTCRATLAAMERLEYLRSITRQKTIQSTTDKNLVLAWYFDQFKQPAQQSDRKVDIPDENQFVKIVRTYAERFYEIMNPGKDIKRFLGNASMRPLPPQVGRCSRGMPSFKAGDYVFVSQRNIDKQFIDLEHFVPCYMEDDKLYYCGENKPSVDAPIQLRLYDALPNIRYIIHSHCYIDGATFTRKSIPCGAIEEVDEVLNLIDEFVGGRNLHLYTINLKGHGSLLMASDISLLQGVSYIGRDMPEPMYEFMDETDANIKIIEDTPTKPTELPVWNVPVQWTMESIMKISAPTLKQAINLAYEINEPMKTGTYVDESFGPIDSHEGTIRKHYNNSRPDMYD